MKNLFASLFLIPVMALAAGCAETVPENYEDTEQASVDRWMEQHNPGAQRLDNGMYMEWLNVSNPGAARPEAGDWLMLNYRGTTFGGNVYSTRYGDEAKLEGTFTYYTHYSPHYLMYSNDMALTSGEITALGKMAEGDSVRLYLPSRLAYGVSGVYYSYGYQGSYTTVGSLVPVIIDLVLKKVVMDEDEYELGLVKGKAAEWGLDPNNYLSKGIYMQLIEDDVTAETVMPDSTVYIEYVGRFLDGFLLDTNVDSVAVAERKDYTEYSPASYKRTTDDTESGYITAFDEAFNSNRIKYNSLFRIVFISGWGYGSSGQSASSTSPVIYPYTPLMFEIRTMPKDYDPYAEDED